MKGNIFHNIRWGQTVVGKSRRVSSQDCKKMAEYCFNAGGEMLIFSPEDRIEIPVAIQSSTPEIKQ